ncbi:MFS transporter [Streptomyces achromogenes]|uniref:MFS transporter n=1 Tax=Streptomyces achromogenes TaxID=67255 RepID=UPI0036FFB795
MTSSPLLAPSASAATTRRVTDPVVRRLTLMTLAGAVGSGLFLTVSLLWFTHGLGLPPARVGVALTLAGLCGLLAPVPAGRLADHWGGKGMLITLLLVQAVLTASYTVIRGYPLFMVLACLVAVTDRAAATARSTLYATALCPDTRGRTLGFLRAVLNCGIGAGAASGSLVLVFDTRSAYVTAILANAVCFLLAAAALRGVPSAPATAGPRATAEPGVGGRDRSALRDLPYLVVTALNAVINMQFAVLEVGFPLWLVGHTTAPHAFVGPLLICNTAVVVLLQTRTARHARHMPAAARSFRCGGLLIATSCVIAALAAHGGPRLATAVLLTAVLVQSLGEVFYQSGSWTLGYELVPARAAGAYQGVYGLGTATATMAGPALLTAVVMPLGLIGWSALAALFAATALAMPSAARWAQRRRTPDSPLCPPSAADAADPTAEEPPCLSSTTSHAAGPLPHPGGPVRHSVHTATGGTSPWLPSALDPAAATASWSGRAPTVLNRDPAGRAGPPAPTPTPPTPPASRQSTEGQPAPHRDRRAPRSTATPAARAAAGPAGHD